MNHMHIQNRSNQETVRFIYVVDFTSLHLIAIIIRAPKNNANITTQDFTNSESDCGGSFFSADFFCKSGMKPETMLFFPMVFSDLASISGMTIAAIRLQSPISFPGLQVAASWSTTAIECTGAFFGGLGVVLLLEMGIEWYSKTFLLENSRMALAPLFFVEYNREMSVLRGLFFLGQGHHDAVFNEVRTSSLLLPSSTYVNHKKNSLNVCWERFSILEAMPENFHWSGNFIVHSIKLRLQWKN